MSGAGKGINDMVRYVSLSLCCVMGLVVCTGGGVWAAETTVTPSVKVRETYDDNIFLKETDDLEHRISPALTMSRRTEQAQIKATAAAEISDYDRHNTLDSVDQRYGLDVDLNPSMLWQVGFSGEYVDDYTFVSALEESGVPAERSRRKRATVSPYAVVALDEKNSLQIDYSFTKTQYDLSAYSDYRTHGGSVGWYHRLSNERTRVIFSVGASRADFDRPDHDVVQKTYRGMVGVEHEFTQTLSATLLAGTRYTKSEFPRAGVVVEEEDTGMVLDGSLRWRFQERLTLSADIDRDIAQSIYGENMTRDRARVGLGIRLAERLRGNLSAAYYRNKTEGYIQSEKRQTYRLEPAVTWRLGQRWSVWGGYSYTWTENRINNRSQERNRVYVQLAFDWPIVWD